MKISVIIPVYNEEKYIGACLDSLISQSVPADEIIVVNNNSTDGTVSIVKKYPVKIINEKKQGMTPARNRGFNQASCEIIGRTDGDTILPPDWIKKIKKSFLNKELIAVSGPPDFYDLPKAMQNSDWPIKFLTKHYTIIIKKALKHDMLYGPNYALRKSAWNKVKFSVCLDDRKVHEDIDLAIHLEPFGKIKFDQTIIVSTSFRRLKRFESYFKYPYKMIRSIQIHKQVVLKQKGKQFVKKMVSKAFKDSDSV